MRLSDQELELASAKGASQGVILVSTKGPMEGASKVGVAEDSSKDASQDASRDVAQDPTQDASRDLSKNLTKYLVTHLS